MASSAARANVAPVDEAREPDDDAAGVAAPVGGVEAGEGRHEVDAAVVLDRACQLFDLGSSFDQPQIVAQPLRPGAPVMAIEPSSA